MILANVLRRLNVPGTKTITLYKDGIVVYRGTISFLKNNRKDLLNLKIDGELKFDVEQGYSGCIK